MNEVPDLSRPRRSMIGRFISWSLSPRIMRRILISLAVVITLIAIIYARVNKHGDRLLEDSKRELAAKGENLDWSAYVPQPVPDDQNIFKAPKMAEWFNDDRSIASFPLDHPITNDFARRFENADLTREITNAADASRYLAWSDQFQEDFDVIAAALKRPYARTVEDYSQPLSMRFPNVATWSALVLTLEQRAKCHLLVGDTEKAWQELTLLRDFSRMVERQGKFITPEGAWMVRGSTKHSLAVLAKGIELHAWTDAQLVTLESQLADTDSIARFADALRCGRALLLASVEDRTFLKARGGPKIIAVVMSLAPQGEISAFYSKQLRDWQGMIDALSPSNGVIHPAGVDRAFSKWKRAQEGMPGLLRDQTWVNEGQVACALERYYLAHREYPERLEALVPQFIARLPHDIVNGEPLKYRRTENGSFLLYSVGWNETDEGGQTFAGAPGGGDPKNGDWVWNSISTQE
jgi:hypothetical protein